MILGHTRSPKHYIPYPTIVQEVGAERVSNKAIQPFPLYVMPFDNHELGLGHTKGPTSTMFHLQKKLQGEVGAKNIRKKLYSFPLDIISFGNYKLLDSGTKCYIQIMVMYP